MRSPAKLGAHCVARGRGRKAALVAMLTVVACISSESTVRADVPHGRSDFWRELAEPGLARARELLRQSRVIVAAAFPTPDSFDDGVGGLDERVALDNALARLERARALAPREPEVLWFRAYLLGRWHRRRGATVERRTEESLAAYEELRRAAPDFLAGSVAFELAVLRTLARDFAGAATEYRLAIRTSLEPETTATIWANLAEVSMLAGDLESAVASYQRALEIARNASQDSRESALASFGLAVALDRLGEHRHALERTRDAIGFGGGSLEVLRSPGVFFEPGYELYWYEALGHEALAMSPDGGPELRVERHAVAGRIAWLLSARALIPRRDVDAAWALLPTNPPDLRAFVDAVDALRRRFAGVQTAALTMRETHLALAIESWWRFFSEGGGASPFARIARQDMTGVITELRTRGPQATRTGRRAPLPAP